MMNVHFSSETDLWETPMDFFQKLNEEFGFDLDVCATTGNAKCEKFFTKEQDGLAQNWEGVCWMNPPYGDPELPCKKNSSGEYSCTKKKCRPKCENLCGKCPVACKNRGHHIDKYVPGIKDWMAKAYNSSLSGAVVVCLVPARTDTNWWHDYAIKGQVRFIKGRLKFGGHANSAPFPSAVVIFRP